VEIRAACSISSEVFTALIIQIVSLEAVTSCGEFDRAVWHNSHAPDSCARGARLESPWDIGYLD
jgi:hypothetical protein